MKMAKAETGGKKKAVEKTFAVFFQGGGRKVGPPQNSKHQKKVKSTWKVQTAKKNHPPKEPPKGTSGPENPGPSFFNLIP